MFRFLFILFIIFFNFGVFAEVKCSDTLSSVKKFTPYKKVQKLLKEKGIQKSTDYIKRRKNLEKETGLVLPARPDRDYKEWVDWYEFLGKPRRPLFSSYKKVQKLVKEKGIQKSADYLKRRKNLEEETGLVLPSRPDRDYKEWVNWYEFLGKPRHPLFSPYKEAQRLVQKYKIQTETEYRVRRREIERLEGVKLRSAPRVFYKEWVGWYEFLGKSRPQKFLPYKEAQRLVQKYKVQTGTEYEVRRKEIGKKEKVRLPSRPDKDYKEWVDWYEFLEKPRPELFSPYKEAQRLVQKYKVQTGTEYKVRRKEIGEKEKVHLPSRPHKDYKEWVDWYEFLGKPRPQEFLPYKEAQRLVQKYKVQMGTEYEVRRKEIGEKEKVRLPYGPDRDYKEWVDWYEFLGKPRFPSYKKVQKLVKEKGIQKSTDYIKRRKNLEKETGLVLPSRPDRVYKEWVNWYEFLGKPLTKIISYEEAQTILEKYGIESKTDFDSQIKEIQKIENIYFPKSPANSYRGKWKGWKVFIETRPMSYERAQKYIKSLNFEDVKEFWDWVYSKRRHPGFPKNPIEHYKIKSLKSFLILNNNYIPYEESQNIIQSLEIRSKREFLRMLIEEKSSDEYLMKLLKGVPLNPEQIYKKEWQGWNTFLGI